MNISDGKAKDLILSYGLECSKTPRLKLTYDAIKKNVLSSKTIQEIEYLVKQIEESEHNPAKIKIGRWEIYFLDTSDIKGFLKNGGFEKIEKKEKRKEEKEKIDFRVSKFKYYTFWPLFGIAILSAFYSGYRFFIENPKTSKSIKELQQTTEKMAKEVDKLQISISNQKSLDSFPDAKVLKDKKSE